MRPFSIFRRLQQTSAFLWFRFSRNISIQHFSSASQWVNEWKKFFSAEPYLCILSRYSNISKKMTIEKLTPSWLIQCVPKADLCHTESVIQGAPKVLEGFREVICHNLEFSLDIWKYRLFQFYTKLWPIYENYRFCGVLSSLNNSIISWANLRGRILKRVNTAEYSMEYSLEYSMVPNWSAGFYEANPYDKIYTMGIFHSVNAP
jgi:hypothetical protein